MKFLCRVPGFVGFDIAEMVTERGEIKLTPRDDKTTHMLLNKSAHLLAGHYVGPAAIRKHRVKLGSSVALRHGQIVAAHL